MLRKFLHLSRLAFFSVLNLESCSFLAQEASYVGSFSDLALLSYDAFFTQQRFRWNSKKNKHKRAKGAAFENRVSGVQHFSSGFFFSCYYSTSGPWAHSYSLPISSHHSRPSTCGKIYIPPIALFWMLSPFTAGSRKNMPPAIDRAPNVLRISSPHGTSCFSLVPTLLFTARALLLSSLSRAQLTSAII